MAKITIKQLIDGIEKINERHENKIGVGDWMCCSAGHYIIKGNWHCKEINSCINELPTGISQRDYYDSKVLKYLERLVEYSESEDFNLEDYYKLKYGELK